MAQTLGFSKYIAAYYLEVSNHAQASICVLTLRWPFLSHILLFFVSVPWGGEGNGFKLS